MQVVSANKNHWGFIYSPIPKHIYRRMKVAKLSINAVFVYLHIIDSLNGKTKTGWTIARTDEQVAESVGLSSWGARTSRRELVKGGFVDQKQYTVNGKRVVGTWTFKLNHTEPASKKTFDKYARQTAESSEPIPQESETNVEQSPTQTCRESLQESVADRYIKSDSQPAQKPVVMQVSNDSHVGGKDIGKDIHKEPPPIVPQNIEKLSLAWNESHEYEEGEEEAFDKYFSKAIRATMTQHAVDENVAVQALIRAFHRTKRNHAGHHPYNYPTAYTGDPDHEESKATPRGKKILQGAIHVVKAGEVFTHKPTSSSNDETITEKPTDEMVKPLDSDKGSASAPPAPAAPGEPVEPTRPNTPRTPLEVVRRNLAGRAAMLKAGIISPLSRGDVLSHAQPGLDGFDDIPGDDVIVGVWNELAPTPIESEDTQLRSESPQGGPEPTATTEPIDQPKPDAFMELAEIQAKIAGLDEMRRSGTLSVDEVAEVTQEIAALKRQKAKVQRDADKCSTSADQNADKGVSDAEGYLETEKEGSTTGDSLARRIAKTIKLSLMVDREYSDEQIVLIVQRQERSIDSAAILEVWYNWSDWSAYVKDMVSQRIQSGSLMPDEVREARAYAARCKAWEQKNDQWAAVV
jgi:hypothetical protein